MGLEMLPCVDQALFYIREKIPDITALKLIFNFVSDKEELLFGNQLIYRGSFGQILNDCITGQLFNHARYFDNLHEYCNTALLRAFNIGDEYLKKHSVSMDDTVLPNLLRHMYLEHHKGKIYTQADFDNSISTRVAEYLNLIATPLTSPQKRLLYNSDFIKYSFSDGLIYTPEDIACLTDMEHDITGNSAFSLAYLMQQYQKRNRMNTFYVNDYADICLSTLICITNNDLTIRKCKNCDRYFIPKSRNDESYCEHPAPQNVSKTCKQYSSAARFRRSQDDPALKLCRQIYNTKQKRRDRNSDIKSYADKFKQFSCESAEWKRKYKSGECTADEFISWLNEQKGKKT